VHRRAFIGNTAAALFAVLAPRRLQAATEEYPNRPVRLIVPSQAGGVYDLLARLWADKIGPHLGTVVVENRAGGSATVGVAAAAKMAPDGYTILLASNATQILQPAMMTITPYDPVHDFSVISVLAASWTSIVVTPSAPATSLNELLSYIKQNPGKVTWGFSGIGDTTHIAGELLKQTGGSLDLLSVPYRGMTPAIRELVSGHLQMATPHITSQLIDLHRNGQVRIIAINAPKRIAAAEDLPTAIEQGLTAMTAGTIFYLFAPAGTPLEVLRKINEVTHTGLNDSEFQKKLVDSGFEPLVVGNLQETQRFLQEERDRLILIAKSTGIKIN